MSDNQNYSNGGIPLSCLQTTVYAYIEIVSQTLLYNIVSSMMKPVWGRLVLLSHQVNT